MAASSTLLQFSFVFVIFTVFVCLRVVYILYQIKKRRKIDVPFGRRRKGCIKTMIIAGSGGHTTEILRLKSALSEVYCPREYIIANSDKMSEEKIRTCEARGKQSDNQEMFSIIKIPRSREVKQSYVTSIATTLHACLYSFPVVFRSRPDLILVNGPGTCIPLCTAGFLLTVLGIKRVHIVYIESFCRVESLSLSGQLLYYFADEVFVQWLPLKKKYTSTRYIGRLS